MELPALDRILVTGSKGLIARNLSFGIKLSRADLDVTDSSAVRKTVEAVRPSAILSLASYDLRGSEEDPFSAYNTNVTGSCNLAKEAARLNIPIVMVSSGAVFNGSFDAFFTESAIPAPLHHYGLSKFLAEQFIAQIAPRHLIVRTGWIFGGKGAHHQNFIDTAIERVRQGEEITASNNQRGSPTYLAHFMQRFEEAIKNEEQGVLHIVNSGAATALDIAELILKETGARSKIIAAQQGAISTIKRSPSEVLVSDKCILPGWQDALREYLAAIGLKTAETVNT